MAKRNVVSPPPGYAWPEMDAARSGLDPKKLDTWWKLLKKNHTKSIFVMKDDRIVFERYVKGFDRHRPHYTASMAKALTGGMSLLFAINDGLMKFENPAWKYVPEWRKDPLKLRITVAHLATHTSGMKDSFVAGFDHTSEPGRKGEFCERKPVPNDQFSISCDRALIRSKPGAKYQ